jgi:hypothetical protein
MTDKMLTRATYRFFSQPGEEAMKFRTQTLTRQLVAVLLAMFALPEGIWSAAQTQATTQSAASSRAVLLKEGTEVKLKLCDKLTSKTALEGDRVNLSLDQNLKVGEITVARAGSIAVGTVSHAGKAGMLGRPGDLGLRLEYLKVDDSSVRLRGTKGKQGKGKEGTAVALTVLFGPIGLIKHGRNAEFKEATPLVAYVDQDTELAALR